MTFAAAVLALSQISACTSQSLETTYATLEESIDRYIASHFSDSVAYTIHRNAGSNRVTVNPSDSAGFERHYGGARRAGRNMGRLNYFRAGDGKPV